MLAALLPLTLAASGSSLPAVPDSPAHIIDGTFDTGDPAVVGIAAAQGDAPFCTGTLVSPHVVVSAGHCADGTDAAFVYFGSDPAKAGGVWIAVKARLQHPMFDPVSLDNDISVIELAAAAPPGVVPIPMSDAPPTMSEPARFVGFGYTQIGPGGMYGRKFQFTGPITSFDAKTFGYGIATCNGDSGGPAFVESGGREVLEGVTSWGDAACGVSGVDTRVDAYRAWVDGIIDGIDPATCAPDGRCAVGCAAPDLDCPCASDGACTPVCMIAGADPDCPAACAAEGTCSHDCPFHDPDCPITPVGGACASDYECGDLNVCQDTCLMACDPAAATDTCGAGTSCRVESGGTRAACLPNVTTGCAVGGRGGGGPWTWILPGLVIVALGARKRARR